MGRKPIDWDKWRGQFVRGNDDVTIAALAECEGAPALQTLRNKSSKEGWFEQRKRYRCEVQERGAVHFSGTKEEVADAIDRTIKIVDAAEMLTRHNRLAKALIGVAAKGLKHLDPKKLKPNEIANLAKLGIDVQRITEGLATERAEVNFKAMSDDELDRFIDGNA